jgi:small subunit ribosomal protein S21
LGGLWTSPAACSIHPLHGDRLGWSAQKLYGLRRSIQTLMTIYEGRLRLQVVVRDNNVDQALRALKKKLQREGVFREMKLRNYYEKPSEKKARQKAEAVRRARKLARKRAQREGGLPAPAAAARPARP